MHDGVVTCVGLSSDGRVLVTGGSDSLVGVWRLQSIVSQGGLTTSKPYIGAVSGRLNLPPETRVPSGSVSTGVGANNGSNIALSMQCSNGRFVFSAALAGHLTAVSALAISKSDG